MTSHINQYSTFNCFALQYSIVLSSIKFQVSSFQFQAPLHRFPHLPQPTDLWHLSSARCPLSSFLFPVSSFLIPAFPDTWHLTPFICSPNTNKKTTITLLNNHTNTDRHPLFFSLIYIQDLDVTRVELPNISSNRSCSCSVCTIANDLQHNLLFLTIQDCLCRIQRRN